MTAEIAFVSLVVGIAAALFVSGRVRTDIVALLVVLAFVLGDVLTPSEALAGFADPVVVMVAGLLVISDMLTRTGVAHYIGNQLALYGGGGEIRMLVLLSLVVGALGSMMSNTAVVAIFVPVVLTVASKTNLNASRLLLPLSYAGLVSGMLTLIATPPNLIVSAELSRAGFEPFGFFAVTPVGAALMMVLIVYMVALGRHLLPGEPIAMPRTPARRVSDLLEEFGLVGRAHRVEVPPESPLVGRTLAGSEIGSRYGLRVIIVERMVRLRPRIIAIPTPDFEIRAGDILVVHGSYETAEKLATDKGLHPLPLTDTDRELWMRETGLAKVLVHPESRLIGSPLRGSGLRSKYGVQVLAVRRGNEALDGFLDRNLASADAMLIVGPWKRIRQLQSEVNDLVVLTVPAEIEEVAPAWRRAPVALAILALMVVLSGLELVPVVVAVLIASLLAVVARCLTMERAYSVIHWGTIVLIAGTMSMAAAMVKTGAADLIVEVLVAGVGKSGPYVMMSALFFLTAVLSAVLSNTATAVLLAPIAIRAASVLGVAPHAFAMTIAIAASAGYVMPIASPAVMLVVGPGKYRMVDFIKVGIPMLILTWLVTIALTPMLFPFD